MRAIIRRLGIAAGALAGALGVFVAISIVSTSARVNRSYALPAESIALIRDGSAVANGRRLAQVFCADCHGETMGGGVVYEDSVVAVIRASNLTAGAGGVGGTYSDLDYERAIRHGVGSDGAPLWIMPSSDYAHFSDQDTADLIAYIRSLEPVDNDPGRSTLRLGGYALVMLGSVQLLHAENIDHERAHIESIDAGVNLAYGEYLARTCTGCHGPDYAGLPSIAPGVPPTANLTPDPAAGLGLWDESDFLTAIRTGVRPDGSVLNPAMPWSAFSPLSDDDLRAIWMYLRSLPPVGTSAGS